jgi:hypothetical protein
LCTPFRRHHASALGEIHILHTYRAHLRLLFSVALKQAMSPFGTKQI